MGNDWMLRFTPIDGGENEEMYFNDEQVARESFQTFDEPDSAEMYKRITLFQIDWADHSETELTRLTFQPD